MNQTKSISTRALNSQKPNNKPTYLAPRLVAIGTAIELVQGGVVGEAIDNMRGGRVRIR